MGWIYFWKSIQIQTCMPYVYSWIKVLTGNSLLKQCSAPSLLDTILGYFQLMAAEAIVKISWKCAQIELIKGRAKHCFKDELCFLHDWFWNLRITQTFLFKSIIFIKLWCPFQSSLKFNQFHWILWADQTLNIENFRTKFHVTKQHHSRSLTKFVHSKCCNLNCNSSSSFNLRSIRCTAQWGPNLNFCFILLQLN
jgi:hypothetical protein